MVGAAALAAHESRRCFGGAHPCLRRPARSGEARRQTTAPHLALGRVRKHCADDAEAKPNDVAGQASRRKGQRGTIEAGVLQVLYVLQVYLNLAKSHQYRRQDTPTPIPQNLQDALVERTRRRVLLPLGKLVGPRDGAAQVSLQRYATI